MGLLFTVGGARGTFDRGFADEVAGLLDHAFGAEGEWEGVPAQHFGELAGSRWADLQRRAVEELGREAVPNLLALGEAGRGVYLPAQVQTVSLPLSEGEALRCASLPGLRTELAELAERWEIPLDDEALKDLLRVDLDPDDGFVDDDPEIVAFAQLALAANQAVRKDCPLWVVG